MLEFSAMSTSISRRTHFGRRGRSGGGTSRQERIFTPVIAREQRQITTAGLVPVVL
jgi:hypothetical protein